MGVGPLPNERVTSICHCSANSVTRVNGTPISFETCPTPIYSLLTVSWGNTNWVVSNRVVSKGPLYPSKTKIDTYLFVDTTPFICL